MQDFRYQVSDDEEDGEDYPVISGVNRCKLVNVFVNMPALT